MSGCITASGCTVGVLVCAASVAMLVVGSMMIARTITPFTGGWTTFGLSLTGAGIFTGPILPVIAALSAYGIVPSVAVGGVAVASAAAQLILIAINSVCTLKN